MINEQTAKQILDALRDKGIIVAPGLSEGELQNIEEALSTNLPSDLRIFLGVGLPISHDGNRKLFPQWRDDPKTEIARTREDIENAFTSDIEKNSYWNVQFGEKPENIEEAKTKALEIIRSWPPLVRIYGHRYLPTEPNAAGNPVFSVWQALDTVYYGNNLKSYLVKEFGIKVPGQEENKINPVPFWSDAFNLK